MVVVAYVLFGGVTRLGKVTGFVVPSMVILYVLGGAVVVFVHREQIPIVPLYFAAERPVIERDGMIMMVNDDRLRLLPGEQIETRLIRFRTLGCYPLTGAIESDADDLSSIVLELLQAKTSERQGRAIDTDSAGSMEKKKQEGYF